MSERENDISINSLELEKKSVDNKNESTNKNIENTNKNNEAKSKNTEITSKKIGKILEKLKGNFDISDEQISQFKDLAEKYSDKSEEELIFEIMKLNNNLINDENRAEVMKKLDKIHRLSAFLSEEQSKKLDKIIELFKKS